MLPGTALPLASLLAVFGPLFTAPSFRTFCGLAGGFLSQAGKKSESSAWPGKTSPHNRESRVKRSFIRPH
jgi:hypothetical protein